ncbi:MAG TPA: hypothetical protein VF092_11495 [Longimicrobium sp.]
MDAGIVHTSGDLEQVARRWERADLIRVWQEIKSQADVAARPPGKAFEYLVVRAFELEGLAVRWPFQVTYPHRFGTMEQLDGVVYLGERTFLIESKNLAEPATIEVIAKLRFRLEARPPGTMGVLFSVQNFTFPTEVFAQFASPLNVLLWSSKDLDHALTHGTMVAGLRRKLEYATERGLPLLALGESR